MKTYILNTITKQSPVQTIQTPEVMPWGAHKDERFDQITDEWYLIGLANDFNRGSGGKLPDDANKYPPVPLHIRVAAREELKRRGYVRRGERWLKVREGGAPCVDPER